MSGRKLKMMTKLPHTFLGYKKPQISIFFTYSYFEFVALKKPYEKKTMPTLCANVISKEIEASILCLISLI